MSDIIAELSAEETALLEADRNDNRPIEQSPAVESSPKPEADVKRGTVAPVEKPEAAAQPEVEPEAEHPPQTVPYSALAEERNRRKEAEKQAREFREQMQRLSGRLDVLAPREEQKPGTPPNVQEQPIEVLQEVYQWKKQQEEQAQQSQQWNQFGNAVVGAAEEYKRTAAPDLEDAVGHLIRTNAVRWIAEGYNEADIPQLTQRYLAETANRAFQLGRNPGEVFYAAAKALGYQKAEAGPDGGTSGGPPSVSGTSPPRGFNGQFQAAEKLATVARGQQAAGRSLSGAGGGSGGEMTAESLASMNEEDFQAWAADPKNERAWRRLMGA